MKNFEWIPVSLRLPDPGVPVFAFVDGEGAAPGQRFTRRIRAEYAAERTLPLADDCEGGTYDEETDTIWCDPGWYESNEYEETHWRVTDPVTHWMPLPEGPKTMTACSYPECASKVMGEGSRFCVMHTHTKC